MHDCKYHSTPQFPEILHEESPTISYKVYDRLSQPGRITGPIGAIIFVRKLDVPTGQECLLKYLYRFPRASTRFLRGLTING